MTLYVLRVVKHFSDGGKWTGLFGSTKPSAMVLSCLVMLAYIWAWYYAAMQRHLMRDRYGIRGSFFWDFTYHFFCDQLSICQEARQVKAEHILAPKAKQDEEAGSVVGAAQMPVSSPMQQHMT
jgi:Cys-rich protein (TIGR01571 family)